MDHGHICNAFSTSPDFQCSHDLQDNVLEACSFAFIPSIHPILLSITLPRPALMISCLTAPAQLPPLLHEPGAVAVNALLPLLLL